MAFVKDTLGFNDKWLMIVGIPIIAFIINIIMWPGLFSEDPASFFSHCFTIGLTYTGIFWLIFRVVTAYYIKIFNKENEIIKRIALQFISMILGYFMVKFVVGNFLIFIGLEYLEHQKPEHDIEIIGSFMSIFLIWAIYESLYFYTKLQKTLREKEQLTRINIQSQLEGLKNQVNPHFLFNSLNTLIYLIPENPDKAVNFVQKLSKVYRYILEIREQKIISIGDELEFLKAYVFLLKERFGENLKINIDLPATYERRKIVPLSLQILFENAIKHNIISTQRPLHIEVFVSNERLVIKNNLQRKNQVISSTHLGLENIKNRYKFFTDKEVEVLEIDDSFVVTLPMVDDLLLENKKHLKTIPA